MSIGRDHFLTALAAIKTAVLGRAGRRKQVAALVTAGQEWLARFDAQDASAAQAFADSKPGQFSAFIEGLPDVTVSAADPADASAPAPPVGP